MTVPGRSTSNAPVFCIPTDPFPRGDRGLGRITKWNLGMDDCCVISTWVQSAWSLSSPQSRRRHEMRGHGGSAAHGTCGEMATLHALLEPSDAR